jgi:hypothetical protein
VFKFNVVTDISMDENFFGFVYDTISKYVLTHNEHKVLVAVVIGNKYYNLGSGLDFKKVSKKKFIFEMLFNINEHLINVYVENLNGLKYVSVNCFYR